jgi:hypothetical protein
MSAQEAVSKAKIVKDYLGEHPNARPQEVERALEAQGVKVKARYISKVKFSLKPAPEASQEPKKREKATQTKPAKSKSSLAKGMPWTFPKNTLEDAIRIPKAIEEKNAGNRMDAAILAKAVGFKQPDWRFLDLLRSANLGQLRVE